MLALLPIAKWLAFSKAGRIVLAALAISAAVGVVYLKGRSAGAESATATITRQIEKSEELISDEEAAARSAADAAARRVCERASDPDACLELVRGRR